MELGTSVPRLEWLLNPVDERFEWLDYSQAAIPPQNAFCPLQRACPVCLAVARRRSQPSLAAVWADQRFLFIQIDFSESRTGAISY